MESACGGFVVACLDENSANIAGQAAGVSDGFRQVRNLVVAVEFLEHFPSADLVFLGHCLQGQRLGRLLASA